MGGESNRVLNLYYFPLLNIAIHYKIDTIAGGKYIGKIKAVWRNSSLGVEGTLVKGPVDGAERCSEVTGEILRRGTSWRYTKGYF